MTLYCEVGGQRVYRASIYIPWRGAWSAELLLPDVLPAAALAGTTTLRLAGLSLVGTVVRGGEFEGDYKALMVGGAAGWRRTIRARSYRSAAGLRLGPIVKDAAAEVGEEVVVSDDRSIGEFFVRAKGPASAVLDRLYADWWIDGQGRTQIARRAQPNVASAFELVAWDPAKAKFEVATESPEAFVPGAKFVSPSTPLAQASLVCHRLTPEKLRTVIYAAA